MTLHNAKVAALVAGGVANFYLMGIATPPVANADQYSYVASLDANGVYYESITDVIDIGKRSCRAMRSGMAVDSVLDGIYSTGFSPMESALVLRSAANEMCPDALPAIEAFTKGFRA